MSEMTKSQNGGGSFAIGIDADSVRPVASPLETLFTYPSLQRLFEGGAEALAGMRTRLERTHRGLERVIRQGPQRESARASRVAEAYNLALGLLRELQETSHK